MKYIQNFLDRFKLDNTKIPKEKLYSDYKDILYRTYIGYPFPEEIRRKYDNDRFSDNRKETFSKVEFRELSNFIKKNIKIASNISNSNVKAKVKWVDNFTIIVTASDDKVLDNQVSTNIEIIKYDDDWYKVIYKDGIHASNTKKCDTIDGVKQVLMDYRKFPLESEYSKRIKNREPF